MGHFLTFVFAILLVGLTILVLAVIFIVKLIRGNSAGSSPEESHNEARMIQELYHGFSRMEERIETLETLLLDTERPKRTKDEGQ